MAKAWALGAKIWLLVAAVLFAISVRSQNTSGGTWELLANNVGLPSMHTAITHFGQAIFLDRNDAGPSQIDLPPGDCVAGDCTAHSLLFLPDVGSAIPLTILTNPWCSSGQFDPNGTLIQTGGNGDGTSMIRYYSPCPPGAECDWVQEETPLNAPRWYATDQLLPDGRIIVVGGRQEYSLEFVPDMGEGLVPFQFLFTNQDSNGDNLYPFVHLLPDGNLWIFCNQASVLYNYTTNTIIRTYPDIPGGPRSYPSAGSSVLLPFLVADYFALAEVIVCGGAQFGAYLNPSLKLPATNTCGRMVVTDPEPSWLMEDMPSNRCMGDMVLLPSGDILIVNGAQAGAQGFNNAFDPALSPVLYETEGPVGQRFSVMAATTIPRMYHSTANLLPDGRVLIAGSNPNNVDTYGVGDPDNGEFPTELRVEAFSPPYLDESLAPLRPSFIAVPTALAYDQPFIVVFSIGVGPPPVGGIVLCMMSAPFATHSFSQGQRLVELTTTEAVSVGNSQYQMAAISPMNSALAPPSYYMIYAVNQGVPSIGAWVLLSD